MPCPWAIILDTRYFADDLEIHRASLCRVHGFCCLPSAAPSTLDAAPFRFQVTGFPAGVKIPLHLQD